MNVLLISQHFHPEKTGNAPVATDCARLISKYGHKVVVICAMPFYPEWQIREEYQGKLFCTEAFENITINRTWVYVPQRASTLKRIFMELSFSAFSFLMSFTRRFDLLVYVSPPLTAGFVAALVALVRRKKLYCFVEDIQPDTAVDLGMLKNKKVIRLMRWIERFMYGRSNKIIVLSEGMARNLKSKGVATSKLFVIPNGVDIRELTAEGNGSGNFRRTHSLEDKFLVLHSGNIGVKQNPMIIVECARKLAEHPDIFFALVGAGAMKDAVQEKIDQYGLRNIRVYPLCDRSELGALLSSADVLLASQRKEVVDIVVPSKVITYFASKRPVLASAHPESEVACMLSENNAGLVVEPDNVDAMSEGILFLKGDEERAKEMGKRAYELLSSKFAQEVISEKYYRPLFGDGGVC